MMTFQEKLKVFQQEYWAEIYAFPRTPGSFLDWDAIGETPRLKSFYDYLLARGYSRFQLSAHGVGRDIQDATWGIKWEEKQ